MYFKKLSFILLIVLTSNYSIAQNKIFKKGIYKTFSDFKANTPSDTITKFRIRTGKDTLSHRFYRLDNDKRLKKEFAFCNDSGLYVSLKQMIKLFPKEDKKQLKDDGNYHVKAIQIGKRYIYFEDYFTSRGAVLWGGLIAGSAARRLKPIIFDSNKKVFNLFKNAEDFEKFIREEHQKYLKQLEIKESNDGKKKRKKNIENRALIRKIIFEINGKLDEK